MISDDKSLPTLRDYKDAIDVQCACNLSGMVHTLDKIVTRVWNEARAAGQGTAYVNRHPIVVLFTAHMLYLCCGDSMNDSAYYEALSSCEKKIEELRLAEQNGGPVGATIDETA